MNQFVRMLQPGYWLPIESLQRAAARFSKRVTERWDVPNGPDVPADLRDVNGRFFRTEDGHRISGLLLNSDFQRGFESASWPLLFAMIPPLTLTALLLQSVLGLPGLLLACIPIAVLVGTIATAAGGWAAVGAFVGGVVLPIIGAKSSAMPLGGGWMRNLEANVRANNFGALVADSGSAFLISLAVLVAIGLMSEKKRWRDAAQLVLAVAAAFAVSAVLGRFWPLAGQLWWLALGCAMPWFFGHRTWRATMLKLGTQGQRATIESSGPMVFQHIEARRLQVENAKRDTTALVPLGTARGVLTKKMDGYAPDEGLPFVVSVQDLDTHLSIFGAPGTGKTSAVGRPLIVYYRGWRPGGKCKWQSPGGGLLVLDGKGGLPAEFLGMKGYTLIAPGHVINGEPVRLGLLEGLSPNDVVLAFDSVCRAGVKSESGSAKFFSSAARTMLRHCAVFVRVLVDAEIEQKGFESPQRVYRWTLHDLHTFGLKAQGSTDQNKAHLSENIAYVKERCPEAKKVGILYDAITYLTVTLPAMDSETRANVWITLEEWLTPPMSHPDLLPWAHVEKGVSVEVVLRGGAVGVSLPSFKYGVAGALIQSLVKARVFASIRRRADRDWRAEGETGVLIVCDEAHELAGAADLDFLPVSRSLGGKCCYLSQSWEGYSARFDGETPTNAFLSCFRSSLSFAASPETGKWIQRKLGTTWSLVYQALGGGVDFVGTARQAAEGPLDDDGHEGHRVFRSLVRRGAGSSRLPQKNGMTRNDRGLDEADIDLSVNVITSAEWKLQPLLLDSEWDGYTAQPFVAVAEVMRGGVRRRDIIQCEPMFTVPADFLEEVTPPAARAPLPVEMSNDENAPSRDTHGASQFKPRHVAATETPAALESSAIPVPEGAPFDADALFGPRGYAKRSH